jgi:putative transposase
MPTHFHLTLKQDKDNGIRTYIQKVSNSFSHYINTRNDSKGPIFEGNFKTVRVETNEQMLHLSRYIHLNPVSSNLVARPEDYEYSSYKMYLGITKSQYIDPSLILDNFSSPEKYKEFVDNQVDYQRSLEKIKYLNME